MLKRITSTKFSQVKLAQTLHKKSTRDQESLFIVEGAKELELAVDNGVQLHSIFIHEEHPLVKSSSKPFNKVCDEVEDGSIFHVTDRVFQSMCYRSSSRIVAIAHKHDVRLEDFEVAEDAFLVICSGIEKPGNLGAVMRSADAVGAHAVIVESPVLDVFNPNVVRASIGTLFAVPVILSDFEILLPWLEQHGIAVIATSPDTDTNYSDYVFPERLAIVVGSEAHGLEQRWFQVAKDVVSIPQHGQADSLNAAMSATIVMYEVLRQRNQS
ncbi:MAG: RNA methyltransferase [Gammaproteobacteria bacterium]|nr:RNA methyltransferase [Gammaproteobacteria bacterium]